MTLIEPFIQPHKQISDCEQTSTAYQYFIAMLGVIRAKIMCEDEAGHHGKATNRIGSMVVLLSVISLAGICKREKCQKIVMGCGSFIHNSTDIITFFRSV